MSEWIKLTENVIPPDVMLEVKDINGNIGFAQPTWYPFKVVSNPNKVGKWSSDVVPCEPYWDGGWMIQITLSELNKLESIVEFREIDGN